MIFKKEERYIVNLFGQVDNLKRRQHPDAEIVQRYEDLKDQIYRRKKSFEMIQKTTDELVVHWCVFIQRKIFDNNSFFVTIQRSGERK